MKKLAFFLLLTALLQGAAYAGSGCCATGSGDKSQTVPDEKTSETTSNFVPANKH